MRRNILALVLATALLATPLALAGGEGPSHEKARERYEERALHRLDHDDDNETEDENETDDDENGTSHRHRQNRHGRDENRTEGRPAWVSAFQEAVTALRASWAENRTAIQEECRAEKPDENATKEEKRAWAHCVRDGYKLWFDVMRAELKEIKAEMRAARDA